MIDDVPQNLRAFNFVTRLIEDFSHHFGCFKVGKLSLRNLIPLLEANGREHLLLLIENAWAEINIHVINLIRLLLFAVLYIHIQHLSKDLLL